MLTERFKSGIIKFILICVIDTHLKGDFMAGKIKRLLSFLTVIVIVAASFPLTASAAPTSDQILNAAVYIIISNEGSYTTVLRNDNGALSIGKLGWHATNALNLLKEIIAKNPSRALSILGVPLYNEIVTSTYWESRILTQSEASVISVLLSTAESIETQDNSAKEYISGYLRHGMSLGISDPAALIFLADYENQNGYYGAANYFRQVMNTYGAVTLSTLYECSSKNWRRTRTYNFCASVNWSAFSDGSGSHTVTDTTAPTISDVMVSNLTSKGFTVSCTASDNSGLDAVYYAVYYLSDGTDGAVWYKYDAGDGKTSHTVSIGEFSNRTGDYCVFIYAFDKTGNYSYAGLNIINVPDEKQEQQPFILTVSTINDGQTDRKITWRAKASGGSGNYQYAFALYRNGKCVDMRNFNDFSDYSYTAKENGTYSIMAAAYDEKLGSNASASSTDVHIFDPIVISSFSADKSAAMLGETVTWSVSAEGGEGALEYSYTLYKDGKIEYSTPYTPNTEFTYKPSSGGLYSVTVNIKDSYAGTQSEQSPELTVIEPLSASDVSFSKSGAAAGSSVTCLVKVFGGSGIYTCVFTIYRDGDPVLVSPSLDVPEFTFKADKAGEYTASVVVTDNDSTAVTVSGGSLNVIESAVKGDADFDGEINASDARLTLRCAAKLISCDDETRYVMDVNGDGVISSSDARSILRASAKIEPIPING